MSQKKARIIATAGKKKETIYVLFNPTDYKLDSSNKYSWNDNTGGSQPIAQFVSGQTSQLDMDLFFDTSEEQVDVRKYTNRIVKLLDIDKDTHAPPLCRFIWSSLNFEGILDSVKQEFTMFNRDGKPIRAKLAVTFKSTATLEDQLKNIPRQSADRTKQRMVKQGDQLWQIADDEYEDPALWRAIAKANDLADPSQLEPGMLLKIPRLYG